MLKLRNSLQIKHACRLFSAAPEASQNERLQSFRTQEMNPTNHNENQLSQFYNFPPQDQTALFQHGGLTGNFQTISKTFNETCIMVREPAVDIINCLRAYDYSKPALRFVLYGKKGSGKTISLAHIIHYAYKNGFLLVHVPWAVNWMLSCKDRSNSEMKEGYTDLNIDAAEWLLHFKTQNAELLKNQDLKVSRTIEWTKREFTQEGSTILELVEFGINRIRFASACISVLTEEVKKLSSAGVCKTLVAIDGFNAFFYPQTKVLKEHKEIVPPNKITITEPFLNVTKFDWKNAAIILTVDEMLLSEKDRISYYPKFLLGKEGFEHLDPFIPVEVPKYSKKEFKSLMDYYRERKWVRSYSGQDEELYFLSNGNPLKVFHISQSL